MRSSGGFTRRLWPEHGLVTVSWIAALALLVLNDHVLKQAGILPGWLTGKLSDFAGLYVAPALLACLLRANSRTVLAGCHLAVGAVFAAINLDPGCAALWIRALAALGVHWVVVTDAADLIALPALLASWRWLGAAMESPRPSGRARHATQAMLTASGVLACLASSPPDDDDGGSFFEGPHLHNPSLEPLRILIRPLRSDVLVDCERVAADPARMLPDSAFDGALAYELRARVNVDVGAGVEHRGCGAAIVSGERLATVLLFWQDDALLSSSVPRTYQDEMEWEPGAIVLRPGRPGLDGYHSVGGDFVYELDRSGADSGETCPLPEAAAIPALSTSVVQPATYILAEVRPGLDGCFALRLARRAGTGAARPLSGDEDAGTPGGSDPEPEPEPEADEQDSYLCVPEGMFPFAQGDTIELSQAITGGWQLLTRYGSDGEPEVQLYLGGVGEQNALAKLALKVHPREDCAFQHRAGSCAETAVAAEVEVLLGSQRVRLQSGDPPLSVTSLGVDFQIAVPFVEWRAVSDPECGGTLGANGSFVAVMRPEAAK